MVAIPLSSTADTVPSNSAATTMVESTDTTATAIVMIVVSLRSICASPQYCGSHSRRRRMLLKINDLSHLAFVNIKPVETTTYAFYAVRNAASFELSC